MTNIVDIYLLPDHSDVSRSVESKYQGAILSAKQ